MCERKVEAKAWNASELEIRRIIPQMLILQASLEQRRNSLKPTKTIVRSTPIVSNGWEDSAVSQASDSLFTPSDTSVTQKTKPTEVLVPEGDWRGMHGFLGDSNWGAPIKTSSCGAEARPGYASKAAHEYADTDEVLHAKVLVLASLLRRSRNCLVYSGAGLSTSSGINDYASRGSDAAINDDSRPRLRSPYEAQPTPAHHVLVQLYDEGFVKYWVQQNHDGLPQKAGLPQHCINEVRRLIAQSIVNVFVSFLH